MENTLKQKFQEKIQPARDERKKLIIDHGEKVIGDITIKQIYSGMRGMISMVTETSKLDPEDGIKFRGYSLDELIELLPTYANGKQPMPEGIFYLMLMGELPTQQDVELITQEWKKRSNVPNFVFSILDSFPKNAHPMTQFSAAILALRGESCFMKAYNDGVRKTEYWDSSFEDSMNLIATLPRIAAYIYRRVYKNDDHIEPDLTLDWSGNFAHMLGFNSNDFHELMRLYLTIHADHEGGNVSAHTSHLVSSALSDAYLSFSAGMNGLAGPLHGLANQEVIKWLLKMKEHYNQEILTKDQVSEYVKKTLSDGRVIPGFGHAVLRKTDPRYIAQRNFALEYLKDYDLFDLVSKVYEVVPQILKATGKVKNPWPNVDAHSGVLLLKYGMKEYDFFTVLFGVSRSLGILSQLIWNRALGSPIERPVSMPTDIIKKKLI
ncbi:MAG: citrate (Si)-synthase, eukaryotic [Flavobacteriales bacterium]|nr:citrate (Si)-synthase, eukaryotic [Flavobacteriales bacterium]